MDHDHGSMMMGDCGMSMSVSEMKNHHKNWEIFDLLTFVI